MEQAGTFNFFGFDFSIAASVADVADTIMRERTQPGVRHLITPNASMLVYYYEHQHAALLGFYRHAHYVLPDGVPIVWLSRLKSGAKLHRLAGSDLFPAIWARIKAAGLSAVFIVANKMLAQKISHEYPGCRCIIPRFFSVDDNAYCSELATAVVSALQELDAGFVFIGLGYPKQEKLGMVITEQLEEVQRKSVLILLLGASFEFYYGLKSRAPQWMQQLGLEWLYRFIQEPRRLWKRYTVDNFRFLLLAIKELFQK